MNGCDQIFKSLLGLDIGLATLPAVVTSAPFVLDIGFTSVSNRCLEAKSRLLSFFSPAEIACPLDSREVSKHGTTSIDRWTIWANS